MEGWTIALIIFGVVVVLAVIALVIVYTLQSQKDVRPTRPQFKDKDVLDFGLAAIKNGIDIMKPQILLYGDAQLKNQLSDVEVKYTQTQKMSGRNAIKHYDVLVTKMNLLKTKYKPIVSSIPPCPPLERRVPPCKPCIELTSRNSSMVQNCREDGLYNDYLTPAYPETDFENFETLKQRMTQAMELFSREMGKVRMTR